jgi:exodeoxyribonuclease VII large subunit
MARLPVSRAEARMAALLRRLEQLLDDLAFRMEAAVSGPLRQRQRQVAELAAAVLRHDPRQGLAQARERLAACRTRLDRSLERMIQASAATLSALDARLHSLSPLAVLDRGYALVLDAQGGLVRSAAQLGPGDLLTTRLADGGFTSRVEAATANKPASHKRSKN